MRKKRINENLDLNIEKAAERLAEFFVAQLDLEKLQGSEKGDSGDG
jgi:hypothetical protein